ncbi:aminotransferase class V-fold PLP-dependent enzyme [Ahrensia sp. R2A130]|uniref:aminotransferase class V-fold PLP-dependent enzyme n=1 Tax=Ahrensia sp. R2A130 TaxID=744979 RepID=UPI0001E0D0F2|nr:aminotransferase class V-fold PLP-dependent enzyme [Ahrensia sp. R2A130]EFL89275.1 aminotransferase family protein [Ahrensia sp. R2A130]
MTISSIDPNGLSEFSVVFTERSLNHMSKRFQGAMNDISAALKEVYHADGVALVPGGGTFGMEAVARQFAGNRDVLVVRNGWFSYRWSQIMEAGDIASKVTVLKAQQVDNEQPRSFAPHPIEDVTARIAEERPAVVFAPHVETSAGVMLPDEYITALADAAHAVGGLMILDCVASGTIWIDMESLGVDVVISAPQKGWSASPCAGLVMMSQRALDTMADTTSSSFAVDLKKWHDIMKAYENGGHAYHSTMPTDALIAFRDAINETRAFGFDVAKQRQLELGTKVRELLADRGFKSVAARGYEAPGVVVCYTGDPSMQNGSKFAAKGMQIAAGVPLQCDEPEDFSTFRLGLFGLDKLKDVDGTVARLTATLDAVVAETGEAA